MWLTFLVLILCSNNDMYFCFDLSRIDEESLLCSRNNSQCTDDDDGDNDGDDDGDDDSDVDGDDDDDDDINCV